MKNRGMVPTLIIAVIAVIIGLSLMGFFRVEQKPYGFSFKQALKLPCGLRIYAPKKDALVTFPFKVYGYANGCGWVPDAENRLGTLDVVGKNGVIYGSYLLRALGDTTKAPYYFEGIITPTVPYTAKEGTFIFTPYAPKGKRVDISVRFQ
jgi:hypothetical protein